jgi:hypothetical protein
MERKIVQKSSVDSQPSGLAQFESVREGLTARRGSFDYVFKDICENGRPFAEHRGGLRMEIRGKIEHPRLV